MRETKDLQLIQTRHVAQERHTVTHKFGTDWIVAEASAQLLQFRVFYFSLLQDRDVGVGVFPESEEVFVGSKGADTSGVGIRASRSFQLQRIRTRYAQMRQGSRPAVQDDAAVAENLLELSGGFFALSG